jgi:hypothetical protein
MYGRASVRYPGRNKKEVHKGGSIYDHGGYGSGISSQENRSISAIPRSASGVTDKGRAVVNNTRIPGELADVRPDRRNGMAKRHESTGADRRSSQKAENIHGRFWNPSSRTTCWGEYWRL